MLRPGVGDPAWLVLGSLNHKEGPVGLRPRPQTRGTFWLMPKSLMGVKLILVGKVAN